MELWGGNVAAVGADVLNPGKDRCSFEATLTKVFVQVYVPPAPGVVVVPVRLDFFPDAPGESFGFHTFRGERLRVRSQISTVVPSSASSPHGVRR
jgi:hypothetical protein